MKNNQTNAARSLRRLILVVAATSCLFPALQAQENRLQIHLGLANMARQDLIFSPFVHRDAVAPAVALSYARSGRWEQSAKLSYAGFQSIRGRAFDYTTPEDEGVPKRAYPHGFTLIRLQYGLGKVLSERPGGRWLAGIALNADLDALQYVYGDGTGFGYFMAFGGGLWAARQWTPGTKNRIEAKLSVPLLAWVARSPYLVNDDVFIRNTYSHRTLGILGAFIADGAPTSLHRYQKADFSLAYTRQVSRRFLIGAAYQIEVTAASKPLPLRSVQQQVHIHFGLQF